MSRNALDIGAAIEEVLATFTTWTNADSRVIRNLAEVP